MSCSGILPYVLLMILTPVLGGFERTCSTESRDHSNGLCGNSLSTILKLACGGSYNIPSAGKRTHEDSYPRLSPLEGIILGKREALSYLSREKRSFGTRFQGIVCECCYNQCSYTELLQYCMLKRKRRDIPQK